ncbi:MAG TPA: type II secretion system F family protein [Vicinamibacterales bacterium]|nr:type II secretion system F family protein [Vicinamibacterales bacterium]
MEFRCRLASPNGEIIEGVYAAENEARLRHEFEDKGLFVLALQPKGSVAGLAIRLPQRTAISTREFLVFNQELATLLKAGMPLVQSLDLLKRRVETPTFKTVLNDVHERVRSGTALSDAFAVHGALFPSVYVASLLAGERSGSLDTVLRRFVEYTKIINTVKRKTISALVYPAILVTLALALVAIIVLRVVPSFSDFYQSFGAQLPLMTRVIVTVSDAIRHQFAIILAVIAAVVVGFIAWVRQPGQKTRLDHAILSLPMLGEVAQKFATSQMSRTLATLLGGGLPLVNALDIATKSMGNQYMAQQLRIVTERVKEGASFASSLESRGVFPEVAVKMAEVGESTGALQEMLNTVADFYDEEISTNMERFVTLIEPSLLVIMGIVVAGLLLALYAPLFQLSSVLTQ